MIQHTLDLDLSAEGDATEMSFFSLSWIISGVLALLRLDLLCVLFVG